jgi:hypothetical protein
MKLIEWVIYIILIFGVLILISLGMISIRNGILQF